MLTAQWEVRPFRAHGADISEMLTRPTRDVLLRVNLLMYGVSQNQITGSFRNSTLKQVVKIRRILSL